MGCASWQRRIHRSTSYSAISRAPSLTPPRYLDTIGAFRGDDGAVAAAMALVMGMRGSEIAERIVRNLDDGGRCQPALGAAVSPPRLQAGPLSLTTRS
jgi:hypothetical protein